MSKKKIKKVTSKKEVTKTKIKTKSKTSTKLDKNIAIKSEKEKTPKNVWKILAYILQFTLIAAVLGVAIMMIYVSSTNACISSIEKGSFNKYLFFWMFIFIIPAFAAVLSLVYGWFGITQRNRTYVSFLTVGSITSFFCLLTTCAVISFITIPELKPLSLDVETMIEFLIGIVVGVIVVAMVFAASQRSFAMKRTIGFLITATALSLGLAIYNTVMVVFPYYSSNLYIACYLGFVWIRTLVVAAFSSVYLVRIFKMNQIKKMVLEK